MTKDYQPLTKEGLLAYFEQMQPVNGRLDMSVDVMIDLMINIDLESYRAGQRIAEKDILERERKAFEAGRIKEGHQSQRDWKYKTFEDYKKDSYE